MSKDPAFLFYSSDFLTGTMLMNNEQKGIYITLLCVQHQHGGIIDKTSFKGIVGSNDIVKIKFVEVDDGFYNERLMNEMIKRQNKCKNLSANALIGWEKRKRKQCKSNAIASNLHMPSDYEDDNQNATNTRYQDTIYQNTISEHFAIAWSRYPRKLGKEKALKKYRSLSDKDREDMVVAIDNYVKYIKSEKIEDRFIKHGSTFFNLDWKDWVNYKPEVKKLTFKGA